MLEGIVNYSSQEMGDYIFQSSRKCLEQKSEKLNSQTYKGIYTTK